MVISQTTTNTHSLIDDESNWWASLNHGGLLIAPSRLNEFFVEEVKPLSRYHEDKLRRDVALVRNGEKKAVFNLLDTVLESLLGLYGDYWQKGNNVAQKWSFASVTGEVIKPHRIWQEPYGGILPVFVASDSGKKGETVKRLGVGRGKKIVSRVIEWLRKANQKIALLTNGRQWRLIHAGADYSAWCEWDIDLWFEEGKSGLQVTALRSLLGRKALSYSEKNNPSPLISAIIA